MVAACVTASPSRCYLIAPRIVYGDLVLLNLEEESIVPDGAARPEHTCCMRVQLSS